MREVRYLRPAAEALAKLAAEVRGRIIARVEAYARDPASAAGSVTALQGVGGLRLRVGDYRVIFRLAGDRIEVGAVGHRRDVYD